MKSGRRSARPRVSPETADVPKLPVWRAFVVQFSRETQAKAGPFAGRVEHMSSGRRAPFGSAAQLVTVLRRMIDQLGDSGI
jgi:hypothetical protein